MKTETDHKLAIMNLAIDELTQRHTTYECMGATFPSYRSAFYMCNIIDCEANKYDPDDGISNLKSIDIADQLVAELQIHTRTVYNGTLPVWWGECGYDYYNERRELLMGLRDSITTKKAIAE